MNKMKKIGLKSAVLALLGMSVASCGDFLEVPPLTMVYEDNYWEEKADVDQIVTGCYTRMQDDDFMRRLFIWGEVRSDNVYYGNRPGLQTTSAEGYILSENILSTNTYTNWSSFYAVIDRCNLVIQKAPEVAAKDPNYLPSDLQATIAEMSALRALCYFYLVRTFKDVPYYTEAITNDEQELNLPATSGDEIVRNLINDLAGKYKNALSVWPRQDGEDVSYGRITRDAMLALLADMSLWIGDYASAANYAEQVIESKRKYFKDNVSSLYEVNGFPLIPDDGSLSRLNRGMAYNYNFGTGGGPESIFELDFTDQRDDGRKSNNMVAEFFRRFFDIQNNNEYGVFGPPSALWTEGTSTSEVFESTDSRIRESIWVDDVSMPENACIAKYAYQSIEWLTTAEPTYIGRTTKNGANWVFYRVSDMMLIKAEALICMMGEEDTEANRALSREAFDLIDAVSDRSGGNGSSEWNYAAFSEKAALMDLLFEERRREFMFEGKRWFDLVRRSRRDGNTTYLITAVRSKYTESATVATAKLQNMDAIYWPYNYDELSVNPNLVQNPAYPETGDSYESTN